MLDVRRRTAYLFMAVSLGHIILISAQVNAPSGVRVLEAVAFGVFAEIQRATSTVFGGLRQTWDGYVALRGVREENERLRQELAAVQIRLQEQRALAERSLGLQQLLELRQEIDLSTVAARVIASDATTWFRTITIDRGTGDGIRPDMAAIAPSGVVGRVVGQPGVRAAKVQLLIDRAAAAGAMVERSRAAGVVIGGDGEPPLRMDYVSNLADVALGDVVVTSGIDGIYPKGFIIGRVEAAERGAGLYKTIRVRPAVDFASLEYVLVVTSPPVAAIPSEGSE